MASSTRQALSQAKVEISSYLGAELDLAKDLFAMAEAISASAQLRGILSDPSTESSRKDSLVNKVFGGKVSPEAIEFLQKVVAKRFSRGLDLVVVLEQLGIHAVAASASKSSVLDQVENELFAFQQTISSNRELQFALGNKSAPTALKLDLVDALLAGRTTEFSKVIIHQSVGSARGRRIATVLDQFAKQVAAYGESLVANVTVSSALDPNQVERLCNALAKTYGQQVRLNLEIDSSILGGMIVQVAGEIIDGSVSNRLQNLKMQLASAAASVNRS